MIAQRVFQRSAWSGALFLAIALLLLVACSDEGDAVPTAAPDALATEIPILAIVTPTPGAAVVPNSPSAEETTDEEATTEEAESTGEEEQNSEEQSEASDGTYVVQAGDTLYAIAVRFGVTVESLSQANGLGDGGEIQAGQVLVIP